MNNSTEQIIAIALQFVSDLEVDESKGKTILENLLFFWAASEPKTRNVDVNSFKVYYDMLWKLATFTWVWNQWTIFLILEMHCCVSEVSEWVNHLFLYFFHLSHILINDDVGFGGPKMHSRMKVAFFGIMEVQKRNLFRYLTQIWFNMLIVIQYYTVLPV